MIGDALYLWGGVSQDLPHVHNSEQKKRVTSKVQIFDITTGKWNNQSTRGNPPLGVEGYLCTTVNNKIYYFGGKCGHGLCYHNSLNELNISTLTWTQLQSTDDSIIVMKRGHGGMMSSEQAGHHCLLIIGGIGCPPSTLLPQAQYYQYPDCRVSTNEHNIYDLTTGNNINMSYYTIRYHLLQSVSLHVIIVCYNSEHQYKQYISIWTILPTISMCVVVYNYGSLHSLKYNTFYV